MFVASDPNTHLTAGTSDNSLASLNDFKAVTLDKPFSITKNAGALFRSKDHNWKNTSYGGATAEFYPAACTHFRLNAFGFAASAKIARINVKYMITFKGN